MSKNVNFSDFSAEQMLFMLALADPNDRRTQKELAEEIGVRPETLTRWKREPGFGEAVWELTYRNLESEIGRISSVLRNQALQGDARAIRLFYEILGKIGSQKTATLCTRDHVASADDVANGLRGIMSERQLDDYLRQVAEHYKIDFPRFSRKYVEGADEVSVLENAELLVA